MGSMTSETPSVRERILQAALELLGESGADAVSTRAVTARAGVQAPALYRLFGDKDGLLDAAVERLYSDWVARKKTTAPPADPVDALSAGFDAAVRFGLDHPAAYRIMQARTEQGPAISAGRALLEEKVARVARAGRLRESPERACALMSAVARGVTLALIDTPAAERDPAMVAAAREAVVARIATDAPAHAGDLAATAVALRALLPEAEQLLGPERALMELWLERIASGGS